MGYHVISITEDGALSHHYLEEIRDLAKVENLSPDSIIYQGEPTWEPLRIRDSNEYAPYLDEAIRAGLKAEDEFYKIAKKKKWVPERISQSLLDFETYTGASETIYLKRPDFRLRRPVSLDVEVKCQRLVADREFGECFYLLWKEVHGLLNFAKFFQTEVVVAFFERNGNSPVIDSLRFLNIQTIWILNGERDCRYDPEFKRLLIPAVFLKNDIEGCYTKPEES